MSPSDPDDLIFLELITGNLKHFPDRWKLTRIVSVREFWEAIADLHMGNPI